MYQLLFFLVIDKIKIVPIEYTDINSLKCTRTKGSYFNKQSCNYFARDFNDMLSHSCVSHRGIVGENKKEKAIKAHKTVYGGSCKFITSFCISKKGYKLLNTIIKDKPKYNFYNYINIPQLKGTALYLDTFMYNFDTTKIFEKPVKLSQKEIEYLAKCETILQGRETYKSNLISDFESRLGINNKTTADIREVPSINGSVIQPDFLENFAFDPIDYYSIDKKILSEQQKNQTVNDIYSDVPYFLEYTCPEAKDIFVYFNHAFNTMCVLTENIKWNAILFPELGYIDTLSKTAYDKLTTIINPQHETSKQDVQSILKIITHTTPLYYDKLSDYGIC